METAASQDLFRSASELLATIEERLDEMADKLADVEGELEDLREATGWLTVQEAAEYTSRSTYQVYRLLYEGEYNGLFARGVASKAKGQWRLHRGRLDRWLASQRD